MDSSALLRVSLGNNSLETYLCAAGTFFAVWFGLWVFRTIILRKISRIAKATQNDFDDVLTEILRSLSVPFYFLLALGAASQFIAQPPFVSKAGYWGAVVVLVYTAIRAATQLVDYFFERVMKKRLREDAKFDPSVVRLLGRGLKLLVWAVALLLVAQNLGYNISALIAGLGIGGLAVAFALQNVLSDVFASFSLYFDKPFRTGDFIIVGEDMGTVERIGIKSTRLTSLWGEQIVLPNKMLTEARVRNYQRMENRRIVFSFGVLYETSAEKLRRIPQMVREVVDGIELADLERAHFKKFGDSSLDFEVMYNIRTSDYTQYMNVQQDINFGLVERFEKEGIGFAYPTRTVYLHKE
ncbi:mechanosensitive ion channel family protein [Patescibacteria group bacterium]|nr:mechanosensitive ion channel family protein [Patescibacteria group bacterium]